MLGGNVSISIHTPSIMVDRPPSMQSLASLAPTNPEMCYTLEHPEASSPVTSPPQSMCSRLDLLPSQKSHSFYCEHVGGGSPPTLLVQSNTLEILPHTKPMVQGSSHMLGPLSDKTLVSTPLLQHPPFMLYLAGVCSANPSWPAYLATQPVQAGHFSGPAIPAPPTHPVDSWARPASTEHVDQAYSFPSTERQSGHSGPSTPSAPCYEALFLSCSLSLPSYT